MATRGRRVNLVELATDSDVDTARGPAPQDVGSRSVPWRLVAPNPLNARNVRARPEQLAELAESLRQHGQIEDCTVVTPAAFVAIFPEFADATEGAQYVQVSGGRRRAAAPMAGLAELNVAVKDRLAASRALFIAATLAENADREDLDPIEEASQVALLIAEVGTGKAAAEQLGKSQTWVSHRVHLLELIEELRDAVRTGEMPVREVRDLHRATPAEQLAALRRYRALVASRERREEQGDQPVTRPRSTPLGAGLKRLKRDPVRIVESLVAELPDEVFRAVLAEGQRRLDGQ
jgi:ParB family chromosome partitioning protein